MKTIYLSFIALLLVGCQLNHKKMIRIGILDGPSAVSFAPMIASHQSIDGYETEFIIKNEPVQIQAMMMQKELDFAVLPTVMAANLYNKGIEYQMAACSVWGTLYIVGNQPGINKLNQLENKVIYTFGQGATADVLLRKQLAENNLKNITVKYDFPGNNELVQALMNNKIQFAVVSEPMVSTLKHLNPEIQIISPILCEDTINNIKKNIFAQSALMVQNDFAKDRKHIMRMFLDKYENSCKSTENSSESTYDWLVESGYYPSATIANESLHSCNIFYAPANSIKAELKRYLQIFYNFDPKSVGGKMPDSNFILE